jgi:L-threonylcarbamoyladenylate synthase
MEVKKKEDFLARKEFFISEILKGKVFIYPTDTIYGIGCDATNSDAVKKIRLAKKRNEKPFSVIAPSKEWVVKNCFINENASKWLMKLPGAYTLILELSNWKAVVKEVNDGQDSLGVRIPNNWFSKFIKESGVPFVTTSVNLTGEKCLRDFGDLKEEIKEHVDYFVDDGIIDGKPSVIVNLIGKERIIKRS